MKKEELESRLNETEDLTPLTDTATESVSGGANPFEDAPRVKEKKIDDRLRESVIVP
ncbi:MAG: hypothetical protein IKE62_03270 [Oscillospiraceae bacterium]|nr:hypothetical protein [Oscillospiraceae bacterium]